MALNSITQAPITGSSVVNKQFLPAAENVERKIMVIGTYDPTITTIADEVPIQIFSKEDGSSKFGAGFMLSRLIEQAFAGGNGVQVWATPQAEAGGAAAATGQLVLSGTTIGAGTYPFYIGGDSYAVTVASGDTPVTIGGNVLVAIGANPDCPVTAAPTAGSPDDITFTAKTKGDYGNDISITVGIQVGDEVPVNLVSTITDMTGGSGIPNIQNALDGMGVGDDRNSKYWTGGCHGYGQDTTTLNTISAYVGEGNTLTGLYDKLVHRPMRWLVGDVASGSAGLTAVLALGDGRKQDRGNGVISIPGSETHPSELAAYVLGAAEFTNSTDPNKDYEDIVLTGIRPGDITLSDRFTSEHDNRDLMAKAGVGSTLVRDGVVYLQNLLTFYHPDTVSPDTNAYKDFEKISRIQNILKAQFDLGNRWKQKTTVSATEKITDSEARKSVIDSQTVTIDCIVQIKNMIAKAWIRGEDYSVENLEVSERAGGNGFDITIPYVLSGNAKVRDIQGEVDAAIAILATSL